MGADAQPPTPQGLQHCPHCARPFVVPIAMLDLIDEGLYELVLECNNCGYLAISVHEDAELERFEQHVLASQALMASAIEDVDVARFIDEASGFTRALEQDLVLPEDF